MDKANLETSQYEQIHILIDNQSALESINSALEELGKTLKTLERNEEIKVFSQMAVEGMDMVLLSLKDIANHYNEEDLIILESMTGDEGKGLSRIRESYLSDEYHLNSDDKALILSATGDMDRLKRLFRLLGQNYKKLSQFDL